jgi:apolipoprotein N-acyltransferase
MRKHGPGVSFLTGWFFGILLFGLGFTWLVHTLKVFAHMPGWMAWSGLLLLSIYHGLAQAVWLLLVSVLRRWANVPFWIAVPITYVPIEHFFPALFPWQIGTPLLVPAAMVQIAELTGAGGVTFMVAMVSGALVDLAEGIEQKQKGWAHRRGLLFAGALLLLCTAYGAIRLPQLDRLCKKAVRRGGVFTVGVAQPNISIYEKEDKEKSGDHVEILKKLSVRLRSAGADLIVWPETAIQVPADWEPAWAEVARNGIIDPKTKTRALPPTVALKRHWLIAGGFVDRDLTHEHRVSYNAGFLIRPSGGVAGVALKNHLLMFGEYLPFEDRFPSLRKRFPHAGDLRPGTPHVIVNITNDSWFGKSREPAQHLALAALRSVEVRKAMIRATNTGISAVIDPTGRITVQTPIFKRAVFVKQVPLLSGKTLFVRLGPWLVYLCLFAVLATLLQRALSRNNGALSGNNRTKVDPT